jgi:hypothetical protein
MSIRNLLHPLKQSPIRPPHPLNGSSSKTTSLVGRVASFNSDLKSEPLIVEKVEFTDDHASMTAAWGDIADKIWVEAKKLDVQIERLVSRLDEEGSSAAGALEQLVTLGSLNEVLTYLSSARETARTLEVLEVLQRFGDPVAVRALIPLLDGDELVRSAAARVAAQFGYLPALDLVSRELEQKANTAEALALLNVIGLAGSRLCADTGVVPFKHAPRCPKDRDSDAPAVRGPRVPV